MIDLDRIITAIRIELGDHDDRRARRVLTTALANHDPTGRITPVDWLDLDDDERRILSRVDATVLHLTTRTSR